MTNEEARLILNINKPVIKRTSISARRYAEAFDMAIKALSVPEREWIPVSERLPEEHKEVLTCNWGGFIEIQSVGLNYWENQHGDLSDIDEVIAWMPLPEPYKEDNT